MHSTFVGTTGASIVTSAAACCGPPAASIIAHPAASGTNPRGPSGPASVTVPSSRRPMRISPDGLT